MRAFIHAFQGKPWNEECESAYRGFEKLGIDCVLFSTNEELNARELKDIVVGGMLIMEHVLKENGVQFDNYNYPSELEKYCGRDIWTVKLKDIKKQKLPIFIKPVREKAATGIIVKNLDDISEYQHLDPEEEIICSEVIDFVSEWRCFVRYGEIIGIQFYNGDPDVKCDRSVIDEAIKVYTGIPAGCSLDFGVASDGRTLLIEMNDGFAIGSYGLPDEEYARLLVARWAELNGTEDIFK